MTSQYRGIRFSGRPATAPRQTWNKIMYTEEGIIDATPQPGRTFTRDTWPPRGRGRGESLTSPRRIAAKQRALEVYKLHVGKGMTFASIARRLGFADASGAYRAYKRLSDRLIWDEERKRELRGERQ